MNEQQEHKPVSTAKGAKPGSPRAAHPAPSGKGASSSPLEKADRIESVQPVDMCPQTSQVEYGSLAN